MKSRKQGRPTTYSDSIAAAICGLISEGNSLRSICKSSEMPSCSTVFLWLRHHPEFSEQYARAREEQADAIADECLDIAENEPDVQRARLKIDARKWFASKMKPRKYGDRIHQEHTGREGGPIVTSKIIDGMTDDEVKTHYLERVKGL